MRAQIFPTQVDTSVATVTGPLQIAIHLSGSTTTVGLTGSLCPAVVDDLERELDRIIDLGRVHLLLDASGLDLLTSAGIATIEAAGQRCRAAGGSCVVWNPSAIAVKVLDICRVDPTLDLTVRFATT